MSITNLIYMFCILDDSFAIILFLNSKKYQINLSLQGATYTHRILRTARCSIKVHLIVSVLLFENNISLSKNIIIRLLNKFWIVVYFIKRNPFWNKHSSIMNHKIAVFTIIVCNGIW